MRAIQSYPDIHEQQVAMLHAAVDAAAAVTVEIGTGRSPLCMRQPRGTFGKSHNLYVGVNGESKQHKYLAGCVGRVGGFAVYSELTDTGFEDIPLPDGCADTVFMGNVFGEPDSPLIMHDFKYRDGIYRGHSSIDAKAGSLDEVRRVLRPDGKLVILETITPYRHGPVHDKPYAAIATLLEGKGFAVTEAVDEKSGDWAERIAAYYPQPEWCGYKSYLVTARPDTEE